MQKTVVTCGKCAHKSVTYSPFMILSMAFEPTLDRCLQTFLQEDQLDCRGND